MGWRAVEGGGAVVLMRWWWWGIAFANMRQERGFGPKLKTELLWLGLGHAM
jgi:hypothetical protein